MKGERTLKVIYMSGAITGEPDEGRGWRQKAATYLRRFGIIALDPTRPQDIPQLEGDPDEITARDWLDVRRSDAVLLHLDGAKVPSIGSMVELGWADALDKPVVAVLNGNSGPYTTHPFIRALVHYHRPTLEEALEAIARLAAGATWEEVFPERFLDVDDEVDMPGEGLPGRCIP